MNRHVPVLLLSVLAGCSETIQLQSDPLDKLVALEITPADANVTLTDLGLPHHTIQYTATGRFSDGSTRDVSSFVVWSIDNALVGEVDAHGTFTASHTAAGYALIAIDAHDLHVTSTLKIRIEATLIDGAFPPPAPNLFDPAIAVIGGEPTRSPTLIYPAEGTIFPQDVSRTVFQYLSGAGNDAFRIGFDSDVLHLLVESGADRWEADGDIQKLIAGSGLAGPIRAEIRAASSTGSAVVYAGNHIMLNYAADHPIGPLWFWSAATNGIMRGGVDVASASKLYPGTTTCVGCHAITRDGTAMAMGYDDTISFDLHTVELATLSTKIAASPSRPMGWATYSPDGARVLVANNGILTLYDTVTGAALGTVPLPAMRYATHPDWSPDGSWVAVALTGQTPNNLDVKAASVARIPYNNGAWGAPQILVAGSNSNNNYFPKWSPDATRLLYIHATTTSQGAPSAELMLVPAAGGTPTQLRIASHRVGSQDDVPDLANTMPTWSPQLGERAWIAFVSSRPYGVVRPGLGSGQIWIASVDLASPSDASSAAFWLPCQDVTVLNNNPVWSATSIAR